MRKIFYRREKYDSIGSLSSLAWKKFMKDRLSVFMLFLVIFAVVIAVLGYLVTPDSSPYANAQYLEIAAKNPGFKIEMLKVRKDQPENEKGFFLTMFYGKESDYTYYPLYSWHFEGASMIAEDYTGDTPNEGTVRKYNVADVVYALSDTDVTASATASEGHLAFMTIDGQKHDERISELQEKIKEDNIIKRTFLLGTDKFGRDVLSQLIIGTRVSLSVGFIAVLISLVIGILLGALAGFFRGWVDNLIVWFINVVWSIPTLLLVIAITFALGKGFWQVFVAVGLTMWVDVARVVRGQILGIREKEFVEAGRALGFRNFRIIFKHILPNVMGPVIVISSANFSASILTEAGLSFLGIGVQPPMPSWGTMIKEHYAYIILNSAHLAILPGIAIMIMVLAFMIIGNGLRDALDTREA
jgi:peptide/nickel transport system permease protein